jgi:hydrogenase expression/formation protein HypC
MCLAIPGLVVSAEGEDPITRMARVDFGGVVKEVSLAYVPQAGLGDYVLVHVGFALAVIDEAAALRTIADLEEMTRLEPTAEKKPDEIH